MVRVVVVLALLLAACGDREPGEWSRPYEGYLLHTDHDDFAVVLVRDKRTGRPIAGATVSAHPEYLLGPDGWAPERARTTTDEFGLAWIPRFKDLGDIHWAVDAEGYAPTETYGSYVSEVVELVPGEDRFGRILDVYGHPMPGVRVEYKMGCAHSPGLRRTTTDKEGRFTLRCIGDPGTVPLERGSLRAVYWHADELSTKGAPLAEFHSIPGHTVTGQVLDAEGNPAAGATLFGHTSGRGPTATADADGRFTLLGTGREPIVAVHHGEDGYEEFNLSDYRQDGPIVLQFGQKAKDVETTVIVEVDVPDDATVHFVRARDGRRWSGRADEEGARLSLPPGPYFLSAGAPDERWVAAGRRVDVEDREGQRFALEVEEQPALHVVVDDLPPGIQSWLVYGGYCYAEYVHTGEHTHYLPPNVDADVVTGAWGRRKVFPVQAATGGVRRVVLAWGGERPARVELGDLPEYVVGYGFPDVREFEHEDALVMWASGRLTLRFLLEWGGVHDVPLDVPAGGLVKVEDPGLPPARPRQSITVLDADGAPVRVLACRVYHEKPWVYETGNYDDTEAAPGSRFSIRCRAPDDGHCVRQWGRVEGAGPWTVRVGDAAVRVAIAVEDEECEERAVYVDGEVFRVEGGAPTPVVGLRAGAHVVIAGAQGHVGRAMRVVLKEGETREIRVRLARR